MNKNGKTSYNVAIRVVSLIEQSIRDVHRPLHYVINLTSGFLNTLSLNVCVGLKGSGYLDGKILHGADVTLTCDVIV